MIVVCEQGNSVKHPNSQHTLREYFILHQIALPQQQTDLPTYCVWEEQYNLP